MNQIVLGLGSNLGDRAANLSNACNLLEKYLGKIIKKSSIIETVAWGFESENKFFNSVIVIETLHNPFKALEICLDIEKQLGRLRINSKTKEYHSRTIDIDILFYNDLIIEDLNLQIPHPLICHRNFVLLPLKEILPDFLHPQINKKIKDI
ncbi:MAG: 2-amino-4-hydroxy-6-hydroxymethyldihydropteridine diphosphokinase [Bacteroidales bacterium]|jgi:2-amino-4-hydroxy-6-hydroxymethyldihydropteridine diphosphokinase|nr:2-amino-4-hydroxy-6-hydroxymethyldihydropteridine diphosphokinase [Bacteroidales bacterium]